MTGGFKPVAAVAGTALTVVTAAALLLAGGTAGQARASAASHAKLSAVAPGVFVINIWGVGYRLIDG